MQAKGASNFLGIARSSYWLTRVEGSKDLYSHKHPP